MQNLFFCLFVLTRSLCLLPRTAGAKDSFQGTGVFNSIKFSRDKELEESKDSSAPSKKQNSDPKK